MKTRLYVAFLLAAILPVALSAAPDKSDKNPVRSDHDQPTLGLNAGLKGPTDRCKNPSPPSNDLPASVPDASSTLLLLGSGLGAVLLLKRRTRMTA